MKNGLVRFLFSFIAIVCCTFLFKINNVSALISDVANKSGTPNFSFHSGGAFASSSDRSSTIVMNSGRAYGYNIFTYIDPNTIRGVLQYSSTQLQYMETHVTNPLSGVVVSVCASSPNFQIYFRQATDQYQKKYSIIDYTGVAVQTDQSCLISELGAYGYVYHLAVNTTGWALEEEGDMPYNTFGIEIWPTTTLYWYFMGGNDYGLPGYISVVDYEKNHWREIQNAKYTEDIYEEFLETHEKTDTTTCNNSHWYGKVLCWFSDLFTALGNWFAGVGQSIWSYFSSGITSIGNFLADIYDVLSGNYSSSDTNSIVDWFEDLNSNIGLEDIITAPVEILSDVSNYYWDNSNNSSHPKSLTLTYKNKNIVLPDGNTFWNKLGAFRGPYNMLFGGFILYSYLLWIYKIWLKLFDPEDDRVEVIKL